MAKLYPVNKPTFFRIPEDLKRDLHIQAAKESIRPSELVRKAIREYLEKHAK